MQAFEEMNENELEALAKIGEHSIKDNYIGKRICWECAKTLAVSINIGLQERRKCARCHHECITYEIE